MVKTKNALAEVIANIDLRCDSLGLIHSGEQLIDPLSEQERADLHWYLEEYWKWPYEGFAERGKQVERLLVDIGNRLYRSAFKSVQARDILQAWRLAPATQRQLSIVSNVPRILSLPWELLHDELGFLVLRTRHPVTLVRRLPLSELAAFPTLFEPPLRILLVTARPEETGFVDPRTIARELVEEMQGRLDAGTIALEFLRPPTLPALRARLRDATRPPIHVLHFDGHGTFEADMVPQDGLRLSGGGQGLLAFEDEEGKLHLVKSEEIAQVLQDSGVHLAVLTSCQSAMSASDDAFSSVASRLIKGGVDAVVAMSASVLVASATRYTEAFYRALAAGTSVPLAQERARQALHDNPRRHIHHRRRDEEGQPVVLHDWWLPHFYQQRALTLKPGKSRRTSRSQSQDPHLSRWNDLMPTGPRYGFSGRAHELLQLERYLQRGKLVVVHGFGGIGKTALVREAASWLTQTAMYHGACFVSFEHGGDGTTLLRGLGHYLGVDDANYDPNDQSSALARLRPVLRKMHILIIADNVESVLPRGEASLEETRRLELWDVLFTLLRMGAGILLTSRDVDFGDDRLAPGKQVAHLALEGLHLEDAYALATNLLTDLGIDRKRVPYAELRELLKQLDCHPLAIQLVLPMLRVKSLVEIMADFAELLPTFADNTETGRNRSLLASLEYSLRELSAEQQALLPHLVLFEGSAFEYNLVEITQIPEADWFKLRLSLEQAALLTVEYVDAVWDRHMSFSLGKGQLAAQFTEALRSGIPISFLRFHPVLIPYLRNLHKANDELRFRYFWIYGIMATSWHYFRGLSQVRTALWLELANIRHALNLVLSHGELFTDQAVDEIAAELNESIGSFLRDLGLTRESDNIWRLFAESVRAQRTERVEVLTKMEWLRETDLIKKQRAKGNVHAAIDQSIALLKRIEALPEGTSHARGSYEHGATLGLLSHCLMQDGQFDAAERRIREALTINDALSEKKPEDHDLLSSRFVLLNQLGAALGQQEQYLQAEETWKEALSKFHGDRQTYMQVHLNLTSLLVMRGDYAEARRQCREILDEVNEPRLDAHVWLQLGIIAYNLREWDEAVHCYQESLALFEQANEAAGIARVCDALADVAEQNDRSAEVESWRRRSRLALPQEET